MGKTVAIIAGGEVRDYSALAPLLKHATVYCADSGYYHCQKLGVTPALLILTLLLHYPKEFLQ